MDVFHACKICKVIRVFHIHWVANFGRPVEVYVDCASYFDSREFRDYSKHEGFDIKRSVPHSHQSNSVERLHCTFIEMLRAALNSSDARPVSQDDWNDLALSVETDQRGAD